MKLDIRCGWKDVCKTIAKFIVHSIYEGRLTNARKLLPFLHRLINRAGISTSNTKTYMQLVCHEMVNDSPLSPLRLSSTQRYIG